MKTTRRIDQYVKSVQDQIRKPLNNTSEYRGYELNNGLKIILISDVETDQSAVSLNVQTGSVYDPPNLPGLAHFCEHMLFMGSEKYPDEAEYHSYLTMHGGSYNAQTNEDNTSFHFSIPSEHLDDALDRFAQFFISPLFKIQAMHDELSAMDFEYQNVVQDDSFKMHQLKRMFCKTGFDDKNFGWGCTESLPGDQLEYLHDQLVSFFNDRYSANIVCLAVLDKRDLNSMAEAVIPHFGQMPNKNLPAPYFEHPLDKSQLPKIVEMVPVADMTKLVIIFPFPDMLPHYQSKPHHLLLHLLHHQAPGSLSYELKRSRIASEVFATWSADAHGFSYITVDINLTDRGFATYDIAIRAIFEYIAMLKVVWVPEWLYCELAKLKDIGFRFTEQGDPLSTVVAAAEILFDYPFHDLLYGPQFMMNKYDEKLFRELLDLLIIDNALIFVISKHFEGKTENVERWSQAPYSIKDVNRNTVDFIKSLSDQKHNHNIKRFYLPEPNIFIPEQFDVHPMDKSIEGDKLFPIVFHNFASSLRCWVKQDVSYYAPKCQIFLKFRNPTVAVETPKRACITTLFVDIFLDYLTPLVYNAVLCELELDIAADPFGITISLYGYNDTVKTVLRKTLEELMAFTAEPLLFLVQKEKYIDDLNNCLFRLPPDSQARNATMDILIQYSWTYKQLLDAAQSIVADDVDKFKLEFFNDMHTEVLLHGNVNRSEADLLLKIITSIVEPKVFDMNQLHKVTKLADGTTYLYKIKSKMPINCALLYFQTNSDNAQENMLTDLLSQVLSSSFIEQLQTKEELGNIVSNYSADNCNVRGLVFLIQGEKSPKFFESRMESYFNYEADELITNMTIDKFEGYKKALANLRLQKPKTLDAQGSKYWYEIIVQQYHFNRDSAEVDALRNISLDDLIKFYQDHLKPSGSKRKKLAVHVYAADEWDNSSPDDDVSVVNDIEKFKMSMETFEQSEPYMLVPK